MILLPPTATSAHKGQRPSGQSKASLDPPSRDHRDETRQQRGREGVRTPRPHCFCGFVGARAMAPCSRNHTSVAPLQSAHSRGWTCRTYISGIDDCAGRDAASCVDACLAWAREAAAQNEVLRAFHPCPPSGKPDIEPTSPNDRVWPEADSRDRQFPHCERFIRPYVGCLTQATFAA